MNRKPNLKMDTIGTATESGGKPLTGNHATTETTTETAMNASERPWRRRWVFSLGETTETETGETDIQLGRDHRDGDGGDGYSAWERPRRRRSETQSGPQLGTRRGKCRVEEGKVTSGRGKRKVKS